MEFETPISGRPGCGHFRPRWTLKKLDEGALLATVISVLWIRNFSSEQPEEEDPLREAEWLRGTLTKACNAAMPLTKQRPRQVAY